MTQTKRVGHEDILLKFLKLIKGHSIRRRLFYLDSEMLVWNGFDGHIAQEVLTGETAIRMRNETRSIFLVVRVSSLPQALMRNVV